MAGPLDFFSLLVRERDNIPLFEAAMNIGQIAFADMDLAESQTTFDRLAYALKKQLPPDLSDFERLHYLNQFFYAESGFCGNLDDYYSTDNSFLHRVISTRRGIPISLAVLFMELARQIGLKTYGISFPGHFLTAAATDAGIVILDPFTGGSLSRPELEERLGRHLGSATPVPNALLDSYLQASPPVNILARMLLNLKAIYSSRKEWNRLLNVQQRLLILMPDQAKELRDRGITYANLGLLKEALADLERYRSLQPQAPDADEVDMTIKSLKDAEKPLG